jgi:uncharacterized membrane protein YcaP (DUF421 family)
MLIVFIRTVILYAFVVIAMRLMGKRQIGQLQPFELVIAIMISDLAAVPMQNTGIPLISGIIPILTLLVCQVTLSIINLKSVRARGIISGRPTILIRNGEIDEEALKQELYTLTDLLEQLRINNVPNIKDVEFAVLETNGEVSVIPKPESRPVVTSDLNLPTNYEGLPLDIILDGKVLSNNLQKASLTRSWLDTELKKQGYNSPSEVFLASFDTDGTLTCQRKSDEVTNKGKGSKNNSNAVNNKTVNNNKAVSSNSKTNNGANGKQNKSKQQKSTKKQQEKQK